MKFRYRNILCVFLLVIIVFSFSDIISAYPYSLKNFIEKDKNMRILLENKIFDFSFTPVESIKVINLGGNICEFYLKQEKYKITISNIDLYWKIQIFASESREKTENIKEVLHKQGYKDIIITKEGKLYKVFLPGEKNKEKAVELQKNLQDRGWQPWLKKIEISNDGDSLFLLTQNNQIISQGMNIILEGDVLSRDKLFPGKLELLLTESGIRIYNTVDLNSLLAGLLCNQFFSFAEASENIIRAQAVVDRSYVINKLFSDKNSYKTIPNYKGLYGSYYKFIRAVNDTEGQVFANYNLQEQKLVNINADADSNKASYKQILGHLFPEHEILDLTNIYVEEKLINADIKNGLNYTELRQLTWWGPRVITLLNLDLKEKDLLVAAHLAQNKIKGRADLVDTVREEGALAGINGGYFSYTGRPLGFMMVEGLVVSEPIKHRTVLGITAQGQVLMDRLQWTGVIEGEKNKENIVINGVNRTPNKNEIVMYNKFFGEKVKCTINTTQITVETGIITNITSAENTNIDIPESGYVVQAAGEKREKLSNYFSGQRISYRDKFKPEIWNNQEIIYALGAGPRLIENGKIRITAEEGDFLPDIVEGRAPRSAVGLTKDRHLVFLTVDGRQPELSIGMTLSELAEYMCDQNIIEAMNLDGGDSARMVVRNYTMNNPRQKRLIASEFIIK